MKYFLVITFVVLLAVANASMRWPTDSEAALLFIDSESENFETGLNSKAGSDDDFPYDTYLLWGASPAPRNSVRFDLTGTKEEGNLFPIHFTQNSPDSVTKINDLLNSHEEFIDEEPMPHKVVINVEWIKDYLIPSFKAGQMIPKELVQEIINEAKFFFSIDDTINAISTQSDNSKIVVVGDIHGQLESTVSIFEEFGYPSKDVMYLFNGDIVDRGDKSLECILMVFAFKIALPNHFFVNRGNHETRTVKDEKFYADCNTKLSDYPEVFEDFHNAFEYLPYGHIVQEKFFVTHGGLCLGMELEHLKLLMRNYFSYRNIPEFSSMLWNDPCEASVPVNDVTYLANSSRGDISHRFHPYITFSFLKRHNLDLLVRSHQLVSEGSRFTQCNLCLTIFSCPNYRNTGNRGAVLIIYNDKRYEIQQMSALS